MLQLALVLLLQLPVDMRFEKFEQEGNIWRATGNPVVVTYQDIQIEAEVITRNLTTEEVTAGLRARFTRGQERLEAESVSFNLESKAGTFKNATGQLGPGYYITAEEVQRTEDGRYHLKNATITTCEGENLRWTFGAASWTIDPEKSVRAKNSVFRLEGIPLFYMPFIVVPTIDRPRSTGLLMPSTSTSTTKGRSIKDSFYWVIDRSADMTFTGEYFTKRGLAAAVDLRAVPNERSSVVVNTFFANDRLGQGGQRARILAHSNFGENSRAVADLNFISSLEFRQVYEEGLNLITSPIETSLAYLTRNRPAASLNFLYSRTAVFFVDQSTVVLGQFPKFEVAVPDRRFSKLPVYFSFDAGFSGLGRRDAAIDTPTFVGRFDINPAIEIPVLQSAAFDWSHRLAVRDTFYTHSLEGEVVSNALNRRSLHYASRFAGPKLERDFGSFKHVIEPAIDYRYSGGIDRFRRTIIVDEVDLAASTNEIEYSLTNRLFGKYEFFSWRLSQKYYFDPTFGGAILPGRRNAFAPLLDITGFAYADGSKRISPIVSTMRISTSPSTSTDVQVDYDTRNRLFRAAGINGGVTRGPGFGSIAYFFTRRSNTHEPNNQLRTTIGYGNAVRPGFSAALSLSYDIERTLFQGSTAQVGYNSDCCGLSLEFMQFDIPARKESQFRFAITLKGIGSYGTLRRQERLF